MSGRKIHKIKHYKKIKCNCGEVLTSEYICDLSQCNDYELENNKLYIYCICGKKHILK